jgi:hypothetical protein
MPFTKNKKEIKKVTERMEGNLQVINGRRCRERNHHHTMWPCGGGGRR